MYRDGNFTTLRCVPDPFEMDSPYPVRFVVEAERRLPLADAATGLRGLVEIVADRVREQVSGDDPEVQEFLKNWEEVQASSRDEARLCEAAATMGLDPYDPREMTAKIIDLLEGPFAQLPPTLQFDLAESASGTTLPADLDWVSRALAILGSPAGETPKASPSPDAGSSSAHEIGYERARRFRERFQLPSRIDDLEAFLRERCGWDTTPMAVPYHDGVENRINALVGPDSLGRPRIATSAIPISPTSRRFLFGRALFFVPERQSLLPERLVTRSNSWPQRASRAFAAEVLAPADELARRVTGEVTFEQVTELARVFNVSEMVIQHQLENHQIAQVGDI